ncbi:MAG: hypothetical protein E2O59_01275 [Gammaproteobacteria bacterium]|nr:MAG: hypothetical protein E2O59_01275 [Gammaproteobacteria bacterium]
MRFVRYAGLFVVFAWFMLGGMGHFLNTEFFVQIMPPYIPYFLHKPLVFFSGVFEVLFAMGVLIPFFRKWVGYLLIALTVAVTPANVHMWLNAEIFSMDENALLLRLMFQVVLVAIIWWSTRMPSRDSQVPQPA